MPFEIQIQHNETMWYTLRHCKFLFEIFMHLSITFACPMLRLNSAQNCSTHFVSYLLRLNSLCCISTHYRFWHSSMYICDCPCHICIQIDHSWGGKTYIYFSNCTNRHHCERSLAGHNKIKVATANKLKTFWSSIYICASFA